MKSFKRKTLAIFLILALVATSLMASPLNDVERRYENDNAYVSLRNAADAYDVAVAWNAADQSVTLTRGDGTTRNISVGEAGGFNDNGRVYIPLEFATNFFEEPWQIQFQAPLISQPRTTDAATATDEPSARGIAGDGITGGLHRLEHAGSVAYIFGSLHGGLDDWFPLADIVEDAMSRADIFAFEIDLTIGATEQLAIINNIMFLPDSQSITDVLPEELYEHYIYVLTSWLDNMVGGLQSEMYYMNPAFLMLSLEQMMVSNLADIDVQAGITVDGYVVDVATRLGRPTVGLMDFEAQQRVLLTPPLEIMLYMIEQFLPYEEALAMMQTEGMEMLDQMIYYYLTNNAVGVIHASHPNFDASTESAYDRYFREVVLNDRSTLFANEIIRLLEDADEPIVLFVTIGKSHLFRHLAGPYFTSTIEQLRLLGVEVTPV